MIKGLLFSSLLLARVLAAGQNAYPAAGARGIGMGSTGLGFRDVSSAFSNIAGQAYLEAFSAIATTENRFLVSEIRAVSAAAALPVSAGTFGLMIRYFGFELYNEQQFGLSYARKLSEGFSLGGQFLYFNTRIPDYGNKGALSFELGFQAAIFPELAIGGRLYNPLRIEVTEGEFLPTTFALGLSYQPSSQLLINLETEKDIDFPVRVKGGIEYTPLTPLALRFGASSNPTSVSLGIGLWIEDKVGLDIASSYHQTLGFSPAFGIIYRNQ